MSFATNLSALAHAFLGEAGNQSIGANGYQKLPSGLIIQWGVTTIPAGGSTHTVTYPITFPTGCMAMTINPQVNVNAWVASASASSAQVDESSGSGATATWIAIGY